MTPSRPFVKAGLPISLPLAEKLWRFSQILKKSPFCNEVLAHTEAQMDFVMEMFARDNPEEFEFVRPGKVKPLSTWDEKAAWEKVLAGKAKDDFLTPMMPSAAVLQRAKEMADVTRFMKKPVDFNGQKPPETPPTSNPDIQNIGKLKP